MNRAVTQRNIHLRPGPTIRIGGGLNTDIAYATNSGKGHFHICRHPSPRCRPVPASDLLRRVFLRCSLRYLGPGFPPPGSPPRFRNRCTRPSNRHGASRPENPRTFL